MNNNDSIHDLDDKEVEIMLKYVPEYTVENAKNIKNKFAQKARIKHKKIPFKKLALVGVIASIVFATTLVYAGIIDINRIYEIVFGEDSEYIESHIEPLVEANESTPSHGNGNGGTYGNLVVNEAPLSIQSEYDGIVMKLISAINDENILRIFATVTDTKGDRLSDSLDFTSWGLSQGYGGNISVIDYNNETKTAILMITSLGDDHQGNATLKINGFSTGREFLENLPESNINIGELIKGHTPKIITQDDVWKRGGGGVNDMLYEESQLLKFDEMDIKFDNVDMFSISNIGFVDGLLHMQVKAMLDETAAVDGYYIKAKFVNSENEIVYDPEQIIYFESDKKYGYESYGKRPHETYAEIIYEDITKPEQLYDLSLVIDYMKSPKLSEANWEFSFLIPEKVTTEYNVERDVYINGEKLSLDMISLSPIGITVHLSQDISSNYNHSDVVHVEYLDGTIVKLDQSSVHTYENESTLIFGGNIIQIEKVKVIVINGEMINVR
ncbi:hypothetical protein E9840_03300 [Tissierella creatinini]|nr:hypothetical protein E9840_03300 [Tissierella creatinini]TJX60695.1 hypothetical protein E8P77_19755 [Soehngenia saccharolytica]